MARTDEAPAIEIDVMRTASVRVSAVQAGAPPEPVLDVPLPLVPPGPTPVAGDAPPSPPPSPPPPLLLESLLSQPPKVTAAAIEGMSTK
jgi:hypothetical protein